jgi:glutaredoxin
MPKVTLHRCPFTFLPGSVDPCTRVQDALDEQGVDYELVKGPTLPRSRRKTVIELTGQERFPIVEFEDGTAYRAESKDMAEHIKAGRLFDHSPSA